MKLGTKIILRVTTILGISLVLLLAGFGTGCGSSPQPAQIFSGNTAVTALVSGTANDQLAQFNIGFQSFSLTSKAGETVNVWTMPQNTSQNAEFIHLNGSLEPLFTVSVPQGIYTAASASLGPASFTCSTLDPSGELDTSTFAYGYVPANQVTFTLPEPITVTGNAMGLLLNLQVSQSATYPSTCYVNGIEPFSINPTFNVTALGFSSPVEEPLLDGEIASLDMANNSFDLVLADGQTITFETSESTVYQGVSGFSQLSAGMLIDMDAAIQSDGSQLAARISVQDSDTSNLSVSTGPLLQTAASQPSFYSLARQEQGYLVTSRQSSVFVPYSYGNATFQISGRFTNLQSLPFVPSFNASNIFDGQNVYVTTHATTLQGGPVYFPATTVTMIPQTINGTISGTSTEGSFTTYTVTLAFYDLIPNLAVQAGQNTVLSDPSTAVVYVDSNTLLLNTQPLAVGNVMRFNGMLFNDNGTLRMDCGQVNDGVTIQPQSQSAAASKPWVPGQRIITKRAPAGREAR